MNNSRREFLFLLSALGVGATLPNAAALALPTNPKEKLPAVGDSPDDAGPLAQDLSGKLDVKSIQKAMERVGNWELLRTQHDFNDDWTFAALYTGFMAAAQALPNERWLNAMLEMGTALKWQPGPNETHADHHAVGQTYLELYLLKRDPAMLAPIKQRFDRMLPMVDNPQKPLWSWCDALYMAPPVCARLYRATGDEAYLHFLDREWNITSQNLFDKQEHLFYRDPRYFMQREKNGKKIFWSRGNGWVIAGLARVLQYLPQQWPTRARYEEQFRLMAERLAELQGPDGLWRSSLLYPEGYTLPEVSGSGFITYAMAWGMRAGLLEHSQFMKPAEQGWKGMVSHIYQDGRLGCIQPVGAAPGDYKPTSSYVYGVGAFLLAGSELLQMQRGKNWKS